MKHVFQKIVLSLIVVSILVYALYQIWGLQAVLVEPMAQFIEWIHSSVAKGDMSDTRSHPGFTDEQAF